MCERERKRERGRERGKERQIDRERERNRYCAEWVRMMRNLINPSFRPKKENSCSGEEGVDQGT